jgi:hypothetical protein
LLNSVSLGCATSNGSAGHAGAKASLKLTFNLDHSVGADHVWSVAKPPPGLRWHARAGRAVAPADANEVEGDARNNTTPRRWPNPKAVSIPVADRLLNAIRSAEILEVRGEGATLPVPLDGSMAALAPLETCFEKNSRLGTDTNPFVAPNRKP